MATLEERLEAFRSKLAPYEVRTEEREQVMAEGEVGKWPGDNPDAFLKSGRQEFSKLKTDRLALTDQVKQARAKEAELHPYPKVERFFDRTIGRVPSFLSPDVKPDVPQPGYTPESVVPPRPTVMKPTKPLTVPGARFQVEDGEIIDTKNREIVSPDQFNSLSTPEEKDLIERQLKSSGHLIDAPDDEPVLEVPEVRVTASRLTPDAAVPPVPAAPPKPLSFAQAFHEAKNNYFQGLADIPAGALKSVAIASKELDALLPDMLKDPKAVEDRFTYKLGNAIEQLAKKTFPTDPARQKDFVLNVLPRAFGSMTGFLFGGVAGAAVKAPGTAAAVLGAGVQGADQYEEAAQFKADDATKRKAFLFGSAVGATEGLPVAALFKRFNAATGGGIMKVLKEGGVTAAQEAIQEWSQQVGSNAIAQQLYDEHRSLFENAGISAEAGGVVGAVTGLVTGILQGRKVRKQQQAKEAPASESPFAGEPPAPSQPPQQPATPDLVAGIPDNLNITQRQPFLVKKSMPVAGQPTAPAQPAVVAPPIPATPEAVPLAPTITQTQAIPMTPVQVPTGPEGRTPNIVQTPTIPTRPVPIEPPPSLAATPEATTLANTPEEMGQLLGGAGKAMADNYYQAVWDKVQKGDTTEGGKPSAYLQSAKLVYDAGGIKSVDDMRAFGEDIQRALDSGLKGHARQSLIRSIVSEWMPERTPTPELASPSVEKPEVAPSRAEVAPTPELSEPKKATPDRSRSIFLGKHGQRRIEFADPLHAELFDFTSRLQKAAKGDREFDVEHAVSRIRHVLNLPHDYNVGSLAQDYRNAVIEAGRAKGKGETATAPDPRSFIKQKTSSPTPESVVESSAHQAATSPTNPLPEPTEAQKKAGNYTKGHVRIAGLDISIENPQGSVRTGVDKKGKPWSVEMQSHYGYIRGTKGKDKDHIDVFVKPGTPEDYSGSVYVIDQMDPKTGRFDEHKVILGASSSSEAKQLYSENYADDWKGYDGMRILSLEAFKRWASDPKATQNPIKAYNAPREADPTPDQVTNPLIEKPRSELPIEQNMEMQLRAEKAQADLEIAGKETGRRKILDYDVPGQGGTPEVTSLQSAAPDWYTELTTGPRPLKRQQIETAIQKIIKNHGVDVGAAVERVKEALLRDREFNKTPWGEDADAIARGEWPSWIERPAQKETPPTPDLVLTAPQSGGQAQKSKDTPKASQMSIEIPPETIGSRPIIGREAQPEEAPLFSKAAQEKDAEQTELPATPEAIAATPEPKAPVRETTDGALALAKFVTDQLNKKTAPGVLAFSTADLTKRGDYDFGGTQAQGKYTPKDVHDAMELGINQYMLEYGSSFDPRYKPQPTIADIRRLLDRVPSQQNRRTEEQEEFQQFSTPPDLAYAMNWAANLSPSDVVLEPSAGLGGLAVFAKNAGAYVVMNEFSPRRAELLRSMKIGSVYEENAEQLHNILRQEIQPTVVIMNPPFSSTAGRMQGSRSTANVIPHLEQAFKRLQPGGRLVALIGKWKLWADPKVLEDWLSKMAKSWAYRARVGLSGEGYKKYGTTYDNQIIIFDKIEPDGKAPVIANVSDVLDAVPLLKEVRDARHSPTRVESGRAPHELRSAEPAREEVPAARATGTRSEQPLSDPVGAVGPGPRQAQTPERRVAGDRAGVPGEPVDVGSRKGADVSPRQSGRQAESTPDQAATPQSDVREAGRARGAERTGSAHDGGRDAGLPADEVSQPLAVETVTAEKKSNTDALTDSVYESYTPRKVKIAGAKRHPGKLVESAALSSSDPPDATYKPHLPKSVIDHGKLSDAQLESVVYAGQAHTSTLPNGERRGFFLGDGPGVGKGRQIAAIILDNWQQGRKKTVWISETQNLVNSAVRDWQDLGGKAADIVGLDKFKRDQPIDRPQGILYTTYTTMASGLDVLAGGQLKAKQAKGEKIGVSVKTRLDQVIDWLGKDFDGLIVFDEAHNMQNSLEQESERGESKPAAKALASVTLQQRLPKARIVYASATAATRVDGLAYADRLGLWGEGTPFPTKTDFIQAIEASGLGAMEIVAQNMKGMGSYISRSLDYSDVRCRRVEHKLTPVQREIYDEMAKGWQLVLSNLEKALEETGVMGAGKTGQMKTKNAMAKSAAYGKFWGANQRFFNQILTSMQMPSVIEDMKQQLENGKSLLVQLVNTNEAIMDRQLQSADQSGADLESLDMTPRQNLMQYIEKSFPVAQFEEYTDENKNVRSRIVTDSKGVPVLNAEAVKMRDELLEKLGAMRVPEGPLEIILNTFGPDLVAEVTGRSERVVRLKNDDDGTETVKRQKRSPAAVREDVAAYMEGKKRILVFSDKGGTGESYHADKTKKNQQQRVHYLIQPGWRADKAVQGLGRSHRTNQASAPEWVLSTTDIKGHKRFISTIARRLNQLGALTKGQRQAGSSGLIDAKDNLENGYAVSSVKSFFRDLFRGQVEGMAFKDITSKLGLNNLIDKDGNLLEERIPSVPQFLNRLLSVDLAFQNRLFDHFANRLERAVEYAQAQGTLDVGMETYRADGGITVLDRGVIHEDPTTKAKVELVHLEAKHSVRFTPAESIEKHQDFKRYVRNTNSGKIWAVLYDHTRTKDSGEVVHVTMLQAPNADRYQYVEKADLKRLYTDLEKIEGRKAWEKQIESEPSHTSEKFYMATGSILSVWDRLPKDFAKIRRLQTTDGERLLGRMLREEQAASFKVKLGKGSKTVPKLTPAESFDAVLDDGATLQLANEWKIKRVRLNNEPRIEIEGSDVYRSAEQLKQYGAFAERVQYATRYFIPTDKTLGERVLEKILKFKPIIEVIRRGAEILKEERGSVPVSTKPTYAGEAARYRQQRAQEDLIGFQSADQEIEQRVREAKKGIRPESLYARLKNHTARVWKLVSREFEELPDTAEFSVLRNDLLRLNKYKGIAADKIQRDLADIIKPLSRKQYDQLEWKALLADLQREAEQGHALPFGYTPEKVDTDLARLDELIAQDPKVQEAWTKRQQLWDRLKANYKASMEAIGFDVSKKLTKQDYFRHQVLEHAKQRAVSGTGSKVRTPTGRGFLKSRKGSTYDINANYVQAEFEVMAQMVYDTQLAKVIKNVDRHHNIRKSLEQEAKSLNRQALADLIAENEEAGALIDIQMKEFKKRIGMHMAMLKKALELDKDDELSMEQIAEIADDLESPGNLSARGVLKAISERKAYTKDLLGPKFMTWDRLVPDTHEIWQPREGNVFYMADSIPANLMKALQEGMLEEAGFPIEKLRKVLAQGGAREEYVIPKEAAATLDGLAKPAPSWFVEMNRQLLGHWKQLMLIAPRKVIRYNVRNLTGDADALFVGNPSAFKRLPQAAKELIPVIFKEAQLTGEAKEWAERGGYGTTLQFQELGDLNDLKAFQKTLDQSSKGGVLSIPAKTWNAYWKTARLATDYREAMMRYAAYLDYLKQMQANNGRPKNFGASRPETVMALPDIRDRAFKLSNELLGAYDRVSVAGQTIRNFWIPFYSWMEVNSTRYFRLVKNALDGGNAGALRRGAVVSTVQAAGFMIRLSAFWGMLQAWNYLMFGDDEEELRLANPTVANRPHILFGRDDNGKIQYLSGVGALGDLLSWFGLDAFPGLVGDIMHDRMTIGEAIKNTVKAPVNKIWQGLTPAVKMPLEMAVRESTYPDVFNPRPINDRVDYLGHQVTLGPELGALRGKPGKPLYGVEDLTGLLVQRSDPKGAAYSTWNGIERKYLERMGKDSSAVFWRSPRGEALANWGRAMADKDANAQATWAAEYERLEREKHGKKFSRAKMWHDMEQSLRAKAPLAGVNKAERAAIVAQLDTKERQTLKKAEQYYRDVIMQVLPVERRHRFEHRLEDQGWLTPDHDYTPELAF